MERLAATAASLFTTETIVPESELDRVKALSCLFHDISRDLESVVYASEEAAIQAFKEAGLL